MEVGATQPGPMKSWGESGAMFRCSGHGADKKMRTDKGSRSMAWKLSAMHPSLFSPPSSFQLPQFPVKETWAGNLRAAAHYMKGRPNASKARDGLTGRKREEGKGERGDAWVLRSKGTHAQCPSTRSTPNATLAQSRPVAVPGTHLAITSFPAAVSGRSVAGLKGVGGAVHCSGLHRLETAQAAFGTFVLPFFYCRI